jgi:predicted DNA-binding transcriptional regulator YafY
VANIPRADRLFLLIQLLGGPRRRTLRELTEALDASPRSVYRDLADLEARGIPIERDEGRYRLLDPSPARSAPLSARERLLLTLALENPALEHSAPYATAVRQLRARFATSIQPGLALAGPDRTGEVEQDASGSIQEAIALSHSVSILYTSLSGGKRAWRGIDPWVVLHRLDAWYLIGRCHIHDEPRTFRLDRVHAVLPIGSPFERPAEFDVQRWFEKSWGVEVSDTVHDVHIRFDGSVAPLIEHARFHPRERKEVSATGQADYFVSVATLDEVARWIVGFGGAAVAIEPMALIDRVRAIAAGAVSAHRLPRKIAALSRRKTRVTETDSGGE